MSGGPPHHPHRKQSIGNTAWNHLQVPNFYASRQPQHAHMSSEHPHLHQPTWHTPTTEPMKTLSHSHLFNLEQMLTERQYARPPPGVDLTLTRNGSSQNGEVPSTPISLSVRDTNKINSLPPSALDIQAVELTKSLSPGLKVASPGLKAASPGLKAASPGLKEVNPGLKTGSPGLKACSPGLKAASPGLSASFNANPGLNAAFLAANPGLGLAALNTSLAASNSALGVSSLGVLTSNSGLLTTNSGLLTTNSGLLSPNSGLLTSNSGLLTTNSGLLTSPSGLLASNSGLISTSSGLVAPSPGLKSPSPGLKLSSPGLKSSSPGLKASSPGLKSSSPGLKSSSPGLKSSSPVLKSASPVLKASSPGLDKQNSPKAIKRATKRVDSILERLNPMLEKESSETGHLLVYQDKSTESNKWPQQQQQQQQQQSVIVQASSSHDENSNSSSILNVPRDEEVLSPYSNEDSLDSNKSRRKRKPSRTMRVPKEGEKALESDAREQQLLPETLNSFGEVDAGSLPRKTRRKTGSESETIDDIAAMVHDGEKHGNEQEKEQEQEQEQTQTQNQKSEDNEPVSVIKGLNNAHMHGHAHSTTLLTPAQRKATNFVEVENKLEEMFAGIEENSALSDESKVSERKSFPESASTSASTSTSTNTSAQQTAVDNVTSTSSEPLTPPKGAKNPAGKRQKRNKAAQDAVNKKKKAAKKMKANKAQVVVKGTPKKLKLKSKKAEVAAVASIKDVYAYDSGSNTSSTKSRGPFVQIKGPRDSPIAVNIINAPAQEDDSEKRAGIKAKKYHDDSEYRFKVKGSKGLHSSTLSNKYDAQTRDATWICAFCKRGPHETQFPGPPGDLFGPYVIGELEKRLNDPFDRQFKSKKQLRALDQARSAVVPTKKSNKRKLSEQGDTDNELGLGLGIIPVVNGDGKCEVWAHEDCVAWAPGVYLVGHKIVGLEEAVWTSCGVACLRCNLKGANVCCLKRGCTNVMHFGCAKTADWQLDSANYKAFCSLHKAV